MYSNGELWIASAGDKKICLRPEMANRHGLITGASGTGKTITLEVIAGTLSDAGVPVFLEDIKGDVSGMCVPGQDSEKMQERIARFGIEGWQYKGYPTRFWDVYGEKGHPVRVTISDMGPMLLSKILNLSDVQESVLNVIFKIADDNGLLLIDLKDLRSMLNFCAEHKADFATEYGNISPQSVATIQRELLKLEQEGGNDFFGEPALDINDWIQLDPQGHGYINVLSSNKLSLKPTLYATFLLWMLSELYEKLPEVGDLDKPKMVFFFDEAHMLFSTASKALRDKIVQVIKLVRSKGVGVYFITQSPSDIPNEVLAQLSNRVQHALRAYTPAEQKTVKAAASSFRTNPAFSTEDAIMELATGEALVSFLGADGAPMIVERARILPPMNSMAQAPDGDVQYCILSSPYEPKYRAAVDRESAYETLVGVREQEAQAIEAAEAEKLAAKEAAVAQKQAEKEAAAAEKKALKEAEAAKKKREQFANRIVGNVAASATRTAAAAALSAAGIKSSSTVGKIANNALKSTAGTLGREAGKSLVRGILGSLK